MKYNIIWERKHASLFLYFDMNTNLYYLDDDELI